MAGKGKIIDLALRQFKMFCFVWCGCKGKDHGLGRCLDCPGCSALSAVAGKGKNMDLVLGLFRIYCFVCCGWKGEDHGLGWCLDCSGYAALSAVTGKGNIVDLVGAWTVQDVLLCLL